MTPRETDYAIFERVFGGKLIRSFDGPDKITPGDVLTDEAAQDFRDEHHPHITPFRPATVANYSESNAEAMAVLQACCEKVLLTVEIGVTHFGIEQQWFVGKTDDDSTNSVMAPTLPAAICAFALKIFP